MNDHGVPLQPAPPQPASLQSASLQSAHGLSAESLHARSSLVPFLAILVLPACATVPRLAAVAPTPCFVAETFFAGRTEGVGTLRIAFRRPVTVIVHGHGAVAPDGAIVLDQTVLEGRKPAATRQWRITVGRITAGRITPSGPERYTGSLSDAVGPVTGTVTGNRLHLVFAMKGGLHADQRLDLAADGASAHNVMIITKLGMTVATLDETIRRVE